MNSQVAVIDAGVAVLAVIDAPQSIMAARLLQRLVDQRVSLAAPVLWRYEVTSVLHRYQMREILSKEEAKKALEIALNLAVHLEDGPIGLCEAAFDWATRLQQHAAYDSFYLALAERLDAVLWTADQRLANGASQLGVDWVRWIGEAD